MAQRDQEGKQSANKLNPLHRKQVQKHLLNLSFFWWNTAALADRRQRVRHGDRERETESETWRQGERETESETWRQGERDRE